MEAKEIDHRERINEYVMELVALAGKRNELERKMGQRHLAIRGLLNLLDSKAQRDSYKEVLNLFSVNTGLSDLIVQCLIDADRPKTPTEIRDFIINYGSEASTQQNLLQSIHTLLKRLTAKKTVKKQKNKDNEIAYRIFSLAERMERTGMKQEEAQKLANTIIKWQRTGDDGGRLSDLA